MFFHLDQGWSPFFYSGIQMLIPFTEIQKLEIVENVISAVKDISTLNEVGYKFISGASGFIAHYDLNGFISCYTDNSLKDDILFYAKQNQWGNYRNGEPNYDYYKSKQDIYNRIVAGIEYIDLTSGKVNNHCFEQIDLFAGVDID